MKRDPFDLPDKRHGSARFRSARDLRDVGMLGDEGADQKSWPIAFGAAPDVRLWGRGERFHRVVGPPEAHELVIGATGAGKFASAFGLTLLNDDGANAIVIDPASGELCARTARYRSRIGHGAIIDPLGVFALGSAQLNPLDLVRVSATPEAAVEKLAIALIPQDKDGVAWVQAGRNVASATLLHLVETKGAKATLMDLADIAAGDWRDDVLAAMAQSRYPMVRLEAANIASDKRADKTWTGVRFSMRGALAFARQEGVRRTLGATSFDPLRLRTERFSVYVVLPNDALEETGSWLRLVYATLMGFIGRRFQPGDRRVRVIVDEFPSLGRFDEIYRDDLPNLRKFGVAFHLAVQSLSQLEELYGAAGRNAIQSSCRVQRILGVNDPFTAQEVARMFLHTIRICCLLCVSRRTAAPPAVLALTLHLLDARGFEWT